MNLALLKSKTVITSAIGFVVAILVAVGWIDNETGAKVGAMLLPLLFIFLRIPMDISVDTKNNEEK